MQMPKSKELFEKSVPMTKHCTWNDELEMYCWTDYPKHPHPLNDSWETWQSAWNASRECMIAELVEYHDSLV
jgi:hypothetical protein